MRNIIIKFLFIKISNSENFQNSMFRPKIGNQKRNHTNKLQQYNQRKYHRLTRIVVFWIRTNNNENRFELTVDENIPWIIRRVFFTNRRNKKKHKIKYWENLKMTSLNKYRLCQYFDTYSCIMRVWRNFCAVKNNAYKATLYKERIHSPKQGLKIHIFRKSKVETNSNGLTPNHWLGKFSMWNTLL